MGLFSFALQEQQITFLGGWTHDNFGVLVSASCNVES
jgi:hypothetical protein